MLSFTETKDKVAFRYEGTVCEKEIDYCASLPCKNGAGCFQDRLGYNCSCGNGYKGTNCEVDLCTAPFDCK